MKYLALKTALLLSTTTTIPTLAANGPMPQGSYEGKGRFLSDHQGALDQGEYLVDTQIKDYIYTATYRFNGESKTLSFSMKPDTIASFDIYSTNGSTPERIGQGYCLSVQCHYSLKIDQTKIEETLTFYEGHLYKVGSKVLGKTRVIWEESSAGLLK